MQRLSILGMGLNIPPALSIAELASAQGVDSSGYKSWPRVCHARNEDDQPSTMAAHSLDKALKQSGVEASQLKLIIYGGVSRDYLPSWSVATEVMKLCGAPDACFGLDIALGCAGTLSGLDLALAWLTQHGGGYAAIICAERWSYTVDFKNPKCRTWAWSDGGGAMVVGLDTPSRSLADFVGAEFSSHAEYNGHVLIAYGGTRAPLAPEGVDPFIRTVSNRDAGEIRQTYVKGYTASYERLVKRLGIHGTRLVCNQVSPPTVALIAEGMNIPQDRVVITGNEFGHLGSADMILGLQRLHQAGMLDEPVALGSSTAYVFGAGLIVPSLRYQ